MTPICIYPYISVGYPENPQEHGAIWPHFAIFSKPVKTSSIYQLF